MMPAVTGLHFFFMIKPVKMFKSELDKQGLPPLYQDARLKTCDPDNHFASVAAHKSKT